MMLKTPFRLFCADFKRGCVYKTLVRILSVTMWSLTMLDETCYLKIYKSAWCRTINAKCNERLWKSSSLLNGLLCNTVLISWYYNFDWKHTFPQISLRVPRFKLYFWDYWLFQILKVKAVGDNNFASIIYII